MACKGVRVLHVCKSKLQTMAKNETARNIVKIAQEVKKELLIQSETTHRNWINARGSNLESFYYSVDNVVYTCIEACEDLAEQLTYCQESLWECVCNELLSDMDKSAVYRDQIRMFLGAAEYC